MVFKVFVVYDSKVEAYSSPFLLTTVGQAVRSWVDVVNDPQTQFAMHPEDYTLFEIAEYDDQTGLYNNLKAHISHGTALEYRREVKGK